MSQLLSIITLLPGLWLVIAPWTGWYGQTVIAQYLDTILGLIILVISLAQITRGSQKTRIKPLDLAAMLLGALLVLAGVFFTGRHGLIIRIGEIVTGILVLVPSWVAWHLPAPTTAKMFSREGQAMLEVSSMVFDNKGIGIKGKLMGAMPATIYLRPEELWKMLALVPIDIIWAAARMILAPQTTQPKEKQKK